MRRLALALVLIASQSTAAPEIWHLDTARSSVRFTYDFAEGARTGSMPVASAEIALDLADFAASRVTVTLDAAGAQAGFFFATQAMKGPGVLDTARHPDITFRSTAITGTTRRARLDGLLTVRGVTRPVTLTAGLYRARDNNDPDRLTVRLTGEIDRRDFGATGFPDYVGPMIALRILARLAR